MGIYELDNDLDRESAADLLAIMGNSKRLLVLSLLVESEISVRQLAELAGLSQSALSQHLAKLRGLKLVTTRRDAQTIYYSCASSAVIAVLATVNCLLSHAKGGDVVASTGLRRNESDTV